jgi:hypothetical protein
MAHGELHERFNLGELGMVSRTRTSAATAPPPEPPPPAEEELLDPAQSPDEDDKIDFFQHLKTLDDRLLTRAVVYVYRIRPKIQKVGSHHIDKYAARLFSEDQLKEDHGGGRYKLMLDTGAKASNLSRVIEIAGPARIFPDEILVDDQGNPRPMQPAGATTALADDSAKSDLVKVLQTVTEALQKNAGSPQQAIQDALAVMKQANVGAVEIIANAAKAAAGQGGGSAADKEVLSELRNLASAIRDMKKGGDSGIADKVMNAAVDRFLNPPEPKAAPDLFDGLKKLGDAFGAEAGGGLGVLRTLLGGQKESFWEGVGREIFSGLSTAVRENFPSIMQWARERAWYSYVEKMQRQAAQAGIQPPGPPQPGTQPPPAVMQRVPLPPPPPDHPPGPAARPAPPPAPQPNPAAQSAPQPGAPGETEMLNMMQREITALIRRTWDRSRQEDSDEDPDGASAAIVVKLAYPAVIPFIRAQFNDLEKLKLLAAADPVLGPITGDPAFPQFAQDFFEELHEMEEGEPQAGTA